MCFNLHNFKFQHNNNTCFNSVAIYAPWHDLVLKVMHVKRFAIRLRKTMNINFDEDIHCVYETILMKFQKCPKSTIFSL